MREIFKRLGVPAARIIFTRHALERLRETQIPLNKAKWMLTEAFEVKLPKEHRRYKREKYQGNELVQYWQAEQVVYTVRKGVDSYTGKPVILVITITDIRMNLRELVFFDRQKN